MLVAAVVVSVQVVELLEQVVQVVVEPMVRQEQLTLVVVVALPTRVERLVVQAGRGL